MKVSKLRLAVCVSAVSVLAAGITLFSFNTRNVSADTIKSNQSVVIKTVNYDSKKVIVVPAKNTVSSDKKSSNNVSYSRGTSSDSSYAGANNVVAYAYRFIGAPYVWGASGPKSFDCSGFTMFVYAKFGISLPHSSQAQFGMGQAVSRNNLMPGDLVFFNTYTSIGHVGIYVGGGSFIHAPSTGQTVTVSSLSDGYYSSHYAGARRILH